MLFSGLPARFFPDKFLIYQDVLQRSPMRVLPLLQNRLNVLNKDLSTETLPI